MPSSAAAPCFGPGGAGGVRVAVLRGTGLLLAEGRALSSGLPGGGGVGGGRMTSQGVFSF